jgi:hypothetical protein
MNEYLNRVEVDPDQYKAYCIKCEILSIQPIGKEFGNIYKHHWEEIKEWHPESVRPMPGEWVELWQINEESGETVKEMVVFKNGQWFGESLGEMEPIACRPLVWCRPRIPTFLIPLVSGINKAIDENEIRKEVDKQQGLIMGNWHWPAETINRLKKEYGSSLTPPAEKESPEIPNTVTISPPFDPDCARKMAQRLHSEKKLKGEEYFHIIVEDRAWLVPVLPEKAIVEVTVGIAALFGDKKI